ncbi:MAG TPA: UDP-N-acetylmuramate dehydrogenase [Bacillota bacterium]|nr:UDP-N-acetylmuramate dehydrogenase [Bacillota bacterium]
MDCQQHEKQLTALISGEIRLNEPMTKHTTWKIGGPADIVALPGSIQDVCILVRYAKNAGLPLTVLGNGSNLLVRDGGIRGLVVKLGSQLSKVEFLPDLRVQAQAGVLLPRLAKLFCQHGLTGLEFAAGIPATLGGAVVMNAGAHGGEISQLVETVMTVDSQGSLIEIPGRELEFHYRESKLQGTDSIVVEVTLQAQPGVPEEIAGRIEGNLTKRKQAQPHGWPNAGSVFRNPPENSAGRLIEEAGLKGIKVGGAMVSEKHANFIINTGNASARDILTLIEMVREQVQSHSSLLLVPEVRIVGED